MRASSDRKKLSIAHLTFTSTGGAGIATQSIHYALLSLGEQSCMIMNDLAQILDLGKPVIWTMHDMQAVTGGCHYFSNCTNWLDRCDDCPQVNPSMRRYPKLAFNFKQDYLNRSNLVSVAPSENCRTIISRSPLYSKGTLETIHNAIDVDAFYPSNTLPIRNELGIDGDTLVIF